MKHPLLETLTEDPPKEDSEDLSDEEVEGAVPTSSAEELAHFIAEEVRHSSESPETGGFTVKHHDLRRRGDHMYWRATLVSSQEPDKVLVFRVDWLGGEHVGHR